MCSETMLTGMTDLAQAWWVVGCRHETGEACRLHVPMRSKVSLDLLETGAGTQFLGQTARQGESRSASEEASN